MKRCSFAVGVAAVEDAVAATDVVAAAALVAVPAVAFALAVALAVALALAFFRALSYLTNNDRTPYSAPANRFVLAGALFFYEQECETNSAT
nr:hypothetical protein [Brevibacillus antibioticus]